MPTPQILNDIIRLLLQLMPIMALVCLAPEGIALRTEGGSTFVIGGNFTRWALWAVIMLSLPQFLLWFNFFGLPVPTAGGAIGTPWLNGIQVDVSTFVNDFLIGRVNRHACRVLRVAGSSGRGSRRKPTGVCHYRDVSTRDTNNSRAAHCAEDWNEILGR